MSLASRGKLQNFYGAALTALNKTKSGVRLIAVGEAIERLVAECISKDATSEAVDLLAPKQLGVAARGGAKRIVHVTRIPFEAGRLKLISETRLIHSSVVISSAHQNFLIYRIVVSALICYPNHCDFNNSRLTFRLECNREIHWAHFFPWPFFLFY